MKSDGLVEPIKALIESGVELTPGRVAVALHRLGVEGLSAGWVLRHVFDLPINEAVHIAREATKPRRCLDCGESTRMTWYMVKNEVWEAALGPVGQGRGVELHIGCLRKRLGRPLTRDDFTDVPINRQILEVLDATKP